MSNFALGPGLVSQIGPFKSNKGDYPKFQKTPWQGGGVPGGRKQFAGHAAWFTSMNPSSFPMQFPMPSTVLKNNQYQSVVTIHDITRTRKRAPPPNQFQKPVQPVGQPVLQTGNQKMGRGMKQPGAVESADIEAANDLTREEPMNLSTPQEGNPVDTYGEPSLPGAFPSSEPLPAEYGTGSVVIHEEEVSRQALGTGGYIYTDASNRLQIDQYNHLQGNYATHEREFVDTFQTARPHGKSPERNDQYRTRSDVHVNSEHVISFGHGSATEYVDEGGGDLVPFNYGGGNPRNQTHVEGTVHEVGTFYPFQVPRNNGTLITTGRRERMHPLHAGNLSTPSRPTLLEQALDFMETISNESEEPFEARSMGSTSQKYSKYTRPVSPIRKGTKRPTSGAGSQAKKRELVHEFNQSKLKRKQPATGAMGQSEPYRRKRKLNPPEQGMKRKNDLEHDTKKRYKIQ